MGLEEVLESQVKSFKDLPELADHYRGIPLTTTKQEVLESLSILREVFGQEMIIYGGIMIYPEIMGYKRHLRGASNDIDSILTPEGLRILENSELKNQCTYVQEYDIGFTMLNNVPVSISYEHIHDLIVPPEFFESTLTINGTRYCSPEFLIMMKLRRNHQSGKHFGKDYVDITSLLASSKIEVNVETAVRLMKEHITTNPEELTGLINPLKKHSRQVKKKAKIKVDNYIQDFLTLTITS